MNNRGVVAKPRGQLARQSHFVRYADDFVVLCPTDAQFKEAHDLVQQHLVQIGLTLSAEKTKQTKFREGFAFRTLDRWIRMRLRCMKTKRKRVSDNWRLRTKHLANLGFAFLSDPRKPRPPRLRWERFGSLMWALFMGSPDARKGHVGQ